LQDEGLKIRVRKQIFDMERRFKRNETKKFRLRSDREILEDLTGSIQNSPREKPKISKGKKKP